MPPARSPRSLTLPIAAITIGDSSPDSGELAALISLGVLGTAAAFVLYFTLIAEAGAGKAALCGYLIPPLALAYGAIFLDETITWAAIGGLVLILIGVSMAGGERGVEPVPVAAERGIGGGAGARGVGRLPCVPRIRHMVDTHCHLDHCEEPVPSWSPTRARPASSGCSRSGWTPAPAATR